MSFRDREIGGVEIQRELNEARERDLELRAERYSELHPDGPDSERDRSSSLLKRLTRAFKRKPAE